MIRSLLKLALLAVVCIVIYNYFFGSASEKDQSRRIFKGVGGVLPKCAGLCALKKINLMRANTMQHYLKCKM